MLKIIFSISLILFILGCDKGFSKSDISQIGIDPNSKVSVDLIGKNRYQLSTNPTTVLDTQTGEVWRATGPVGGPYHFVRICYRNSNLNELSPLPNSSLTQEDLKSYQKECSSK